MQYTLVTETTETCVAMYNLDSLPDYNVAKDWEERKDGGKGSLAVYDEERDMVDLETICKIPYTRPPFIHMCDDYDLVSSINELLPRISLEFCSISVIPRTWDNWYM